MKKILTLLGVFYVLGLILSNLYLLQYGIYDISLLKIEYMATGASFSFFVLAPFLLLYIPSSLLLLALRVIFQSKSIIGVVMGIFVVFIGSLSILLLIKVVIIVVTNETPKEAIDVWKNLKYNILDLPEPFLTNSTFNMLSLLTGGSILLYLLGKKYSGFVMERAWEFGIKSTTFIKNYAILLTLMCLLGLGYAVTSIAPFYLYNFHMRITQAFGGKKPFILDIQIDKSSFDEVSALGKVIDEEGFLRGAPVFHETDKFYYLWQESPILNNPKPVVVTIPKSSTLGTRRTHGE